MKRYLFHPGKLFLGVVVAVILIALVGCSTPSTPAPTQTPSTTPSSSLTPSATLSPTPKPSATTSPSPAASPSPTPTPTAAAFTINIASKANIGNYLVDSKGMTLYYFTKDTIGKSTAVGATLQAWPLFNSATFTVPSSLSAADFGTITRDDGAKVTTYKGWPLYYFAKDLAAGDILGEVSGHMVCHQSTLLHNHGGD